MKTTNTNNDSQLTRFISKDIRMNKYLFITGICFIIYSLIEISDCVFLFFIIINLAPNVYLSMGINIPEIQQILLYQPIYFLPFFLGFTLLRITSTIGIFENLAWGFYIGVISLILTIIMDILFIPFGFIEMFFSCIILIILFNGYFGKKPIL